MLQLLVPWVIGHALCAKMLTLQCGWYAIDVRLRRHRLSHSGSHRLSSAERDSSGRHRHSHSILHRLQLCLKGVVVEKVVQLLVSTAIGNARVVRMLTLPSGQHATDAKRPSRRKDLPKVVEKVALLLGLTAIGHAHHAVTSTMQCVVHAIAARVLSRRSGLAICARV